MEIELRILKTKTYYVSFDGSRSIENVQILCDRLNRREGFKNFSFFLADSEDLDMELTHRIQIGWIN